MILALLAGCSQPAPERGAHAPVPPNQPLLDEVNRSAAWFHARKTRPIWAKQLAQDQQVNTLEGSVLARAGDYLCRGAAGELWPQQQKDLERKYVPTEVFEADGWRQYAPRPDAEGVMAAQVTRPFQVEATWGTLSGKAGDYLLKNYRDRDNPHPADVWLVDQQLFHATYETVKP